MTRRIHARTSNQIEHVVVPRELLDSVYYERRVTPSEQARRDFSRASYFVICVKWSSERLRLRSFFNATASICRILSRVM